jgi:TPR repeat protein
MDAQVLAATCCHLGLGGPRDLPAALRWYEAAAKQGDTSAMFALAFLYEGGDGVTPEPARAKHWYRVAAERGVAAAQFHLGLIAEEHHALDEAVQWYSLAAAQRHGLSRQALNDLERTWPASRLAVGRARAAAWRKVH